MRKKKKNDAEYSVPFFGRNAVIAAPHQIAMSIGTGTNLPTTEKHQGYGHTRKNVVSIGMTTKSQRMGQSHKPPLTNADAARPYPALRSESLPPLRS